MHATEILNLDILKRQKTDERFKEITWIIALDEKLNCRFDLYFPSLLHP